MRSGCLMAIAMFCLSIGAQGAIVITSEDGQGRTQQYFEKGAFVLVEAGGPAFGVDAEGNCWFVSDGQRVFGQCDSMFASMDKMREDAMAGMSERDRTLMEQMLQSQLPQQAPEVASSGTKQIAGYANECYKIGASHEICVSTQLLEEVEREMGKSYFMELQTQFGASDGPMGMRNPTQEAILALSKKGFPMEDRQRVSAIPGMNAAMLQQLPKAQRDQILQQMGAVGAGQMQGSQVTMVDKNGVMPELDFSGYPTVSFEEFMQQMMGAMGGNRPMR
jgi:hypothetical protein